ncbi:hypothetical protein [Mangrovimonas futianensis]|nr:hypothetical protein [Mangrovimonas futianensis]MCF1421413.1 hypothetical protein [Mangrovimonas futianensis]
MAALRQAQGDRGMVAFYILIMFWVDSAQTDMRGNFLLELFHAIELGGLG